MIAVVLPLSVLALVTAGAAAAKLSWPVAPGRHRMPKRIPADEMAEIEEWLAALQEKRP